MVFANGQSDPPVASVVIVNYNYGQFIGQAIDSALAQTYPHLQVLVVDDGSTDGSREVIASYGDRVETLLKANTGHLQSYNAALPHIRGGYVIFLDSDDVLLPDAVADIVAAFADGRPVKVHFYLDNVDRNLCRLGSRFPTYPLQDHDPRRDIKQWGYYVTPPASGNGYAKAFLDEVLPLDESGKVYGDGYLTGIAGMTGRVRSIHKVLGLYRSHGQNASEASETKSVLKLHSLFLRDYDREKCQGRFAAKFGFDFRPDRSRFQPGVCKQRLLSLRLDRDRHPIREDTILGLVGCGLVAAATFPYIKLARRVTVALGFLFLGLAPKAVLKGRIDIIVSPRGRGPFLRLLLQNKKLSA